MGTGIIEIEIRGYEKYRPRKDIKDPWWFKSANKIFEDDDLFDFSLEEMAVWWYILAIASQQQTNRPRISVRKASARITPALLRSTIEKLVGLGIVSYPKSDISPGRPPDGSCTDHVRVAAGSCTLEERRGEGEEKRGGEENAPPESSPVGNGIASAPALIAALPKDIRETWVDQCLAHGGSGFVDAQIIDAFGYYFSKAAGWSIQDWISKISGTINRNKKHADEKCRRNPAFMATATPRRARASPEVIKIEPVSMQEALSNASNSKLSSVISRLAVVKTMPGAG